MKFRYLVLMLGLIVQGIAFSQSTIHPASTQYLYPKDPQIAQIWRIGVTKSLELLFTGSIRHSGYYRVVEPL